MRINTRLKLAVSVPVFMSLFIGLALFFSYQAMEKDWKNGSLVRRIRSSVTELNTFVQSYIHYHEERPKQQFLVEYDSMTQLIAGIRLRNPEQQRRLDKIRLNSESMKDLFLRLVSNYESSDQAGKAELLATAEERLEGQLLIRSRDMDADASRLRSMVDDDIRSAQTRTFTLILFVALFTTVPLTVVLIRMMKSITTSLSTLRKGTEVIGAGNLGHRIGMTTPDELGDLSHAVDHMTEQLQAATVSKDELQQEVEERKRAEELLSENEARLKRAQEIAHLGSWELDLVNNILTWSDEVYRIFGLQPQEFGATYEAFLEAVHPDDRTAVSAAYSGSLREGRDDYEIEHRVVRKSTGEIRYVHEKCQHFRDETGRIIWSIGMVHDITERKMDEEEIRDLNEELKHKVVQLESANQELEAFSYSVSHDLRSPLRSIDGFSLALLEDYAGKLDAEGRDHLDRVRGATRRMAQLIDDLLKLSRVTRMEMKRERVNLSVVATQIAGALRNSRPDRTAEFMVADDLIAFGDERLLTVALENLFANAWKFAEKKPQTVIEFGATLLDGRAVYFVRDNGAGFDMAYADKLFSPFQRLHQETEFPGTGIGLATVKRVVNRHGGRVWIEGEVEKGATVYFTL